MGMSRTSVGADVRGSRGMCPPGTSTTDIFHDPAVWALVSVRKGFSLEPGRCALTDTPPPLAETGCWRPHDGSEAPAGSAHHGQGKAQRLAVRGEGVARDFRRSQPLAVPPEGGLGIPRRRLARVEHREAGE